MGIADVAPTLPIRALKEKGMPYNFYLGMSENLSQFEALNIPVSGTMEELVQKCDVLLEFKV